MASILALVAINTLLFLGLSVAKFTPWPDPLHPRWLRDSRSEVAIHPPPSPRQRMLLRLTLVLKRH